jgi:ComF family protein
MSIVSRPSPHPGPVARTPFGSRCAACNRHGDVLCRGCGARVQHLVAPTADGVVAAIGFEGVGRDLVTGLKYRNQRRAARVLADLLVQRLGPVDIDVVTWAPTGSDRRATRGFDQAELVARAVARRLGLPCRRLLFRVHGASQTGRSRAERLAGPVFVARPTRRPRRVLVVDDVVTTGATLRAAARALSIAGADRVVLAAVGATPAASRHVGTSDPGDTRLSSVRSR